MDKKSSIDTLELSVRSRNALHRSNIHTVDDLLKCTEAFLGNVRNLGIKSINEILAVIEKYKNFPKCKANFPYAETLIEISEQDILNYLDQNSLTIDSLEYISAKSYNYLTVSDCRYLSEIAFMSDVELTDKYNIPSTCAAEISDHCHNFVNELRENLTASKIQNEEISPAASPITEILKTDKYKPVVSDFVKFNDVPLDRLGISNRSKNCLLREGFHNLSDIIFMDSEAFSSIKSMGTNSVTEMQSVLNNYWSVNESRFRAFLSGDLSVLIADDSLKSSVLNLYSNIKFKGLSLSEIEEQLGLSEILSQDKLKKTIGRLIADNELIYVDFRCYKVYPAFVDYIEKYDNDRNITMVKERLCGKTLDAIGQHYGLTRERVRQILYNTNLKIQTEYFQETNFALFDEDYYRYFFETYNFDHEAATTWLGISDYVINYFELNGIKQGNQDLESALDDTENLDAGLRLKIKNYLHRNQLFINGKWVNKKISDLEDVVVQNFCKESVSFSDFIEIYNNFLSKAEIPFDQGIYYTSDKISTRKNRLSESRHLLWTMNEQIRAYDIDANDYTELLDSLHLDAFENIEISTLKFFRMYPEVMQKYDLRNHYELHNLLRKIIPEGSFNGFKCSRMPHICFGEFDRNQALLEILKENAPISTEALANIISEAFGYDHSFIIMTCLSPFYCYLRNGYYVYEHKKMSNENMKILKSHLTDDLYLIEDIKEIYVNILENADPEEINSYTLKTMGFSLSYNFALQNFRSLDNYIEHILTRSDIIDVTRFKKALTVNQTFYAKINELRKALKVIEFEPGQYITLSKLQSGEVTKNDLLDFCDSVYAFTDDSYFSINSIRADGFDHPLFEYGFSDLFYSGLLYADERFTNTNVYGNRIFKKGCQPISIKSFLLYIIESHGSIDIYDLMNELSGRFACHIDDKSNIIWKLKSTDVFFDRILERLYLNAEMYYHELDEGVGD